jgi:hypothetical protein
MAIRRRGNVEAERSHREVRIAVRGENMRTIGKSARLLLLLALNCGLLFA